MTESIVLAGREIRYELEYKRVKNINLRIRPDGSVHVSANRFHSRRAIESFLQRNEGMILRAVSARREACSAVGNIRILPHAQERRAAEETVSALCRKHLPTFAAYCGGAMPEIRYRKMKSRWGSCRPKERVLTFNTRLTYVPQECAEYVVVHEFAHFVRADHSKAFYAAVASALPDWKERRALIRKYEGILSESKEPENE